MENAMEYIPQRPPFVMVDQVLHADDVSFRTSFTIKADNILVEDGCLKEPGLVENIAQTAAAGAGYISKGKGLPVRVGYIGSVRNLEISGFPKINDEIITEITIEKQIFDVSIISGKISCNGIALAYCEMKIFIINQ